MRLVRHSLEWNPGRMRNRLLSTSSEGILRGKRSLVVKDVKDLLF
jgi:hypothetical protein